MAINQAQSRQRAYTTILMLLAVAAALPLLGVGVFAGAMLALMVMVWLVRAGDAVRNRLILWAIVGLVLIENIVFMIGFLR